jgi:hypothetical protein
MKEYITKAHYPDRGPMTHDELLDSIEKMMNHDAIFMKDALLAVVELHKPEEYTKSEWGIYCPICKIDYPCATIQGIEKELG